MRIAIVNLTAGGISGGYKKYLQNILPLMDSFVSVKAVLCALPGGIDPSAWFAEPLKKTVFTPCKPVSLLPLPDQKLKAKLDEFKPDLIFVPVEKPFTYKGVPRVSMLLNMAPMSDKYEPGSLIETLRMKVRLWQARTAITTADYVIAPSDFVKRYITENWGVAAERVSTVYFGADRFERITAQPARFTGLEAGKFFLAVGSMERYRGFEDIITALDSARKMDPSVKCAICTNARPEMRAYLERTKADSRELAENLFWFHSVSDAELLWLYQNAAAFIMTSRVEAGPNTALECMGNGIPAISINLPPHPEFFREAALYYDTPDQLAALMLKLADEKNKPELNTLRLKAKTRAQDFGWDKTALETLYVFTSILTKRKVIF